MKASTIISDLKKANDDQLRKIGWGVRIHHLERKQMEGVQFQENGEPIVGKKEWRRQQPNKSRVLKGEQRYGNSSKIQKRRDRGESS